MCASRTHKPSLHGSHRAVPMPPCSRRLGPLATRNSNGFALHVDLGNFLRSHRLRLKTCKCHSTRIKPRCLSLSFSPLSVCTFPHHASPYKHYILAFFAVSLFFFSFLFFCLPEVSHTPGLRRSGRQRVAPLKFWRGDNIQYGVDDEGLPIAEGIIKGPALPEPSSSSPRYV